MAKERKFRKADLPSLTAAYKPREHGVPVAVRVAVSGRPAMFSSVYVLNQPAPIDAHKYLEDRRSGLLIRGFGAATELSRRFAQP